MDTPITQLSPDKVRELEAHLFAQPQVDLRTSVLLHGRICARTILIPAGTILTGAQTNIDNVCVVSGDITVTTTDGAKRLTGFHVLPASAGFKRAGIAHADTWWTTLHHTDHLDIVDVENEMTDETNILQTTQLAIARGETQCLG